MSNTYSKKSRDFYAQTYDATVSDWQGEIDFYRAYAAEVAVRDKSVLEIACGTGRVAIRLAKEGVRVVGLDFSPPMLEMAREKSQGMSNMEWVEEDMISFELGETFGLIIIPGHAFQNLVKAEDQVACLRSIERHLDADGKLVIHLDHQNMGWLGDLVKGKNGVFEDAEKFTHPVTGRQIHTSRSWIYEPSTQTAIVQTVWEEVDDDGKVVEQWDSGQIRLHCVFRFEMEHLLALTGFEVEALYGNFFREPLDDKSDGMIWVAKK
jgi:ubiquinone/menaquinone biosynthesis C-methylase UbiE